MDEYEQLARERDLYAKLLELGHGTELQASLEEALRLAVEVTGAEQGYLQLSDVGNGEPRWAMARADGGETDVEIIRARISTGIVRHTLGSGDIVHSPSALIDPKLSDLESVRKQRIEAVLCVPLGSRARPSGVLYLQKRWGEGPFPEAHVELAKTFARHAAPLLERLAAEEAAKKHGDPTRRWRDKLELDGIIGRSPALARVLEQVSHFAKTDLTILVTGPSGAGKTSIVESIHKNSARAGRPFQKIGASLLKPELASARLFGYVRGAFTGAEKDTPGLVDAANGGTLFIDDVDSLPMGTQAQLLQFIQDRTYTPEGSTEAKRADVRMVFATNANLELEVAADRFRKDLFYRINAVWFRMPKLSERREDIPLLAERFLLGIAAECRTEPLPISPLAMNVLENADWPGEVRELENCIRAALPRAMGEGAKAIESRHLFPGDTAVQEPERLTYHEATRRFQRGYLMKAQQEANGDVAKMLDLTGLSRSTVYGLLKQHGLGTERR